MDQSGFAAPVARRALAHVYTRVLPLAIAIVALAAVGKARAQIVFAIDDSYTIAEDSGNSDFEVLDNDLGSDLEIIAVDLPGGGTVEIRGGEAIRYRPNDDFFGTDSFIYTIVDAADQPSQATVTVTVLAVADAPRAENDELAVEEDTADNVLAVLANDTEVDGETFTITAVTMPNEGGTVSIGGDGGSLVYTPLPGFNGEERFGYTIEDSSGQSDEAEVRVTVSGDNDPPTAIDDSFTIEEDSGDNDLEVLANDSDPDLGDVLAVTGVGTPSNGTVSIEGGGDRLRYRPNDDFEGTDTFTYTVSDEAGLTATANVSVTVTGSNDLPTAVADTFTVDEDSADNFLDVLTNDSDPEGGALTITAVGATNQGGSVTIAAGGTELSYTPAPEYDGSEQFQYTISDDDGGTATANVTITVEPRDDAPVIDPDPIPDQTVEENRPASIDLAQYVTDNDSDDSLVFTLAAGSDPLPDGLELSAAGLISGTPIPSSSVGTYNISFVVASGANATTSAPFVLTVLGAGRVDLSVTVSATPNPVATNEAVTWQFTVANSAPDTSVSGVRLDIVVGGQVPFAFDDPGAAGCTAVEAGNEIQLGCAFAEPLGGGATTSVSLTGRGLQAGDVVATATVSIDAAAPIDDVEENDSRSATLSVAQSLSEGPIQRIDDIDARAVAAGDLDGDGFEDLVVATGASQGALVLLNVVDPTNDHKRALSTTPLAVSASGTDNDVALADLDADGDLDIVTAGGAGRANAVIRNEGGGFAYAALGGAEADSRAVAVGDVDGDGILDLVFGNVGANALHRGAGTSFGGAQAFGAGQTRDVALVDLFGDPLPEVVLANGDGDAQILRYDGGTFALDRALPTGPTTSVESGDFNGDGLVDLAFGRDPADADGGFANLVFLNTAATAGGFLLSGQLGAASTSDVAGGDTDLDGDTDLIFLNRSGAHQIFVNSGDSSGDFVLHSRQFVEEGGLVAVPASLGIDDRLDLAVAGGRGVAVFYNDGEGNLGLGDVEPPVLELVGDGTVSIIVEAPYDDPGAQATDAQDGDLTSRIEVDNPVDVSVVGTYTVRYEVTDLSGNSASPLTRTVRVQAREDEGGGGGGSAGAALLALLASCFLGFGPDLLARGGRRSLSLARRGDGLH